MASGGQRVEEAVTVGVKVTDSDGLLLGSASLLLASVWPEQYHVSSTCCKMCDGTLACGWSSVSSCRWLSKSPNCFESRWTTLCAMHSKAQIGTRLH